MTNGELNQRHREEVLGTLADSHPVWVTLVGILAEDESVAEESLCRVDLADGVRHYQAGYLAHVRDLRDNLLRWRAEGQKQR